jgi:glycerol uptake facilitator-like aquaporin
VGVGGVASAMMLTFGPITGGLFNPARSIGPLLVFSGQSNG